MGLDINARNNEQLSALHLANGTGIAPLLGMIAESDYNTEAVLLWGMKNSVISNLYLEELEQCHKSNQLGIYSFVYSEEEGVTKTYVQEYVNAGSGQYSAILEAGGTIYICGSIAMRDAVLSEITKIAEENSQPSIKDYINRGQILTDCY